MADANLGRPDRSHQCHATSTPQVTSRRWRNALGEAPGCDDRTKSMTGYLLGAARCGGGIATIWLCTARPHINLDDPDDEVRLDVVRGEPRAYNGTSPPEQLLRLRRSHVAVACCSPDR
jgi:3-oxoacyl-[acyl-carrier-protein] synthase II